MSEDQAVRSRKPGRSLFRINVKTMMLLVATSSLVIWSARRIWEDSTQSPYIRVLQFGNTADRRIAARKLLATPRPGEAEKAVSALILGLGDDDAEVRTASANSLGSVLRELLDGWKTTPGALRTNQPLVSTASRALIGLLNDHNKGIKTEAIRSLVAVHFRSVPRAHALPQWLCLGLDPSDKTLPQELRASLVKTLSDQDDGVRAIAALALGELGPFLSQDIPVELLDLMNDNVTQVRQTAASACGRYEDGLRPLVPDLFARLERAQPPFRNALRVCLNGWRGKADTSLVPLLRQFLRSSSPNVRECAAVMLARLGSNAVAATPELLAVLNEPFAEEQPKREWPDDQPDPASHAVWALSYFPPTPQIVAALVKNLRSDLLDQRAQAAYHLGNFGPAARTAVPALIEELHARAYTADRDVWDIAAALGQIAPGTEFADASITALVEALRSKTADTRRDAAIALGRFGPRAKVAIPVLKTLTKDPEAGSRFNGDVGQAAKKALEAIEPAAVPSAASPR
jgi:HEAT repeat protein